MIKTIGLLILVLTLFGVASTLLPCITWKTELWNAVRSESRIPFPCVVVEPEEWDFGQVNRGQTLRAHFTIHNAGGERLVLQKSNSTCDCLTALEPEILIEPGQERVITTELNSNNGSGRLRIELDYQTNDPHEPLLKLFSSADIQE